MFALIGFFCLLCAFQFKRDMSDPAKSYLKYDSLAGAIFFALVGVAMIIFQGWTVIR